MVCGEMICLYNFTLNKALSTVRASRLSTISALRVWVLSSTILAAIFPVAFVTFLAKSAAPFTLCEYNVWENTALHLIEEYEGNTNGYAWVIYKWQPCIDVAILIVRDSIRFREPIPNFPLCSYIVDRNFSWLSLHWRIVEVRERSLYIFSVDC